MAKSNFICPHQRSSAATWLHKNFNSITANLRPHYYKSVDHAGFYKPCRRQTFPLAKAYWSLRMHAAQERTFPKPAKMFSDSASEEFGVLQCSTCRLVRSRWVWTWRVTQTAQCSQLPQCAIAISPTVRITGDMLIRNARLPLVHVSFDPYELAVGKSNNAGCHKRDEQRGSR